MLADLALRSLATESGPDGVMGADSVFAFSGVSEGRTFSSIPILSPFATGVAADPSFDEDEDEEDEESVRLLKMKVQKGEGVIRCIDGAGDEGQSWCTYREGVHEVRLPAPLPRDGVAFVGLTSFANGFFLGVSAVA